MSSRIGLTRAERQRYVLRLLRSDATVLTTRLCQDLSVSGETVRRDLKALEERGLLRRVYGGAMAPNAARSSEPPSRQRESTGADAKNEIGAAVAELVREHRSLYLDVGTTVAAVARALAGSYAGMVTTASLLVADALADSPRIDLIVAPGRLRHGEYALTGTATHEFLRRMHFDVAILSCGGIDASTGATDFTFDDIDIKRTVAASSQAAYVVADSAKFGVVGSYTIGSWHDLTGLVTNIRPPEGISTAIARACGRMVVAGAAADAGGRPGGDEARAAGAYWGPRALGRTAAP